MNRDQLRRRIEKNENVISGMKNKINGAVTTANGALSASGGTITGNLHINGNLSWGGEATAGDFQGTWQGKSLSGAQLQLLSTLHQMNAIGTQSNSFTSGGFANVQAQVNQIITELINSNYMA